MRRLSPPSVQNPHLLRLNDWHWRNVSFM
jgi:hypothetical protein